MTQSFLLLALPFMTFFIYRCGVAGWKQETRTKNDYQSQAAGDSEERVRLHTQTHQTHQGTAGQGDGPSDARNTGMCVMFLDTASTSDLPPTC